ncbi:hypothetical protein JTF19_22160, partial [Enterobacteriaceae bacterium RIT814]|nr:hypothetical protein [Enterobacteriaceae bacterium RIT 814]
TLTATATDSAGNVSKETQLAVTDTVAPEAPTNLQLSTDGTTITGSAEPGSTVTIRDANGNIIGKGQAGSDGKFTIDLGAPVNAGE